ncbi:DUF4173 domain-containing protein [Runella sp. MFBS21]|uniref:DUF4153 domain-containing protein n=1 Tax=Runella sp. MFBS21 TaxID=3034018 RepID=UPI0023F8FA01|nr:DUF4153 domain-containing protein [Runella sp. MFBS21]MDF7821604.1 DUF4173 domain-containing protein [Runella sp. MFBS21]
MDKKLLFWGLAVGIYTYLFYDQLHGYNVVVFSVVIIGLIMASQSHVRQSKEWWLGCATYFAASLGLAWHTSPWLPMMYWMSLLVLAGLTYAPKSSLLVAFCNGFLNLIGVSFFWKRKYLFQGFKHFVGNGKRVLGQAKYSLYVIPFSVTAFFYLLYCWANPEFGIELPTFELEVDFLLIGYILCIMISLCGLFYPVGESILTQRDIAHSDSVERIRENRPNIKMLALAYQNKEGVISFVMLNFLISIFLVFNLLQILVPGFYPSSKDFSGQLHEGFNALIISILFAIGLIMYYFKGNLNFYSKNKLLIRLAVIWIVLNACLGILTFYKNTVYIQSFGLTFKKVGVHLGLLLTLGGLILTYVKIKYRRSNMFLWRRNLWMVYIVTVTMGLVDWSRFMTWYNINYAKHLDLMYISTLEPSRLPYLKMLIEQKDSRVAGREKHLLEEIKYWKSTHKLQPDWRSRCWDVEWLRKTL